MKLIRVLAASAVALGCGSTNGQDQGLTAPGVASADSAPDVNPDGIPYPADHIGRTPRKGSGTGATAGNRIQNFKFLGYVDADESKGLQPISLADYFDPSGARYRLIHIQAAGVWCSACQEETKAVVTLKSDLDQRKVAWLVSMAEGPTPGVPAVQKNLDAWIAEFHSPFTHWLDPGNKNLGPFYDQSALPWNGDIDARTMEILTSGTGGLADAAAQLAAIDDTLKQTDVVLTSPLPPVGAVK